MSYIDSFPLTTPRDGQRMLCQHLDDSPLSAALIQVAPTGTGKSPHAVTVAMHDGGAYIISPNRSHVTQYANDFPILAVGRAASDHLCTRYKPDAEITCEMTADQDNCYCPEETCPYVKERNAWLDSDNSISTTAYLIARHKFPVKDHPLRQRPWVIVDEAHKMEDDLLRQCGISIPADLTTKLKIDPFPVPPPSYIGWDNKPELKRRDTDNILVPYLQATFLPAIERRLAKLAAEAKSQLTSTPLDISAKALKAQSKEDQRRAAEVKYLISLQERIPHYFTLNPSEIVAWVEITNAGEPVRLEMKPLSVSDLYHRYVTPHGRRTLLLSATIPFVPMLATRLALPAPAEGEKRACRVASPFPPENHRIRYFGVGKMTYQFQEETFERMLPYIKHILDKKHPGQRGLIHGHTTRMSQRLKSEFGDRLILAASSGEDAIEHSDALDLHKLRPDSVLVSPSMTEGVDLKGDASVFQVIIKVPFLPISDPWVAATKAQPDGQLWYAIQTASILTQALGRSLRTMEDTCTSYILDSSFEEFFLAPIWRSNTPVRLLFPEPLRSLLEAAILTRHRELQIQRQAS